MTSKYAAHTHLDTFQPDLVAHSQTHPFCSFLSNALSNRDCRDSSGLGTDDVRHPLRWPVQRIIQNKLWNLCGFSTSVCQNKGVLK